MAKRACCRIGGEGAEERLAAVQREEIGDPLAREGPRLLLKQNRQDGVDPAVVGWRRDGDWTDIVQALAVGAVAAAFRR